ncbi:MAG: ABC transporter permease [Clostridia bacterium]|nr:ABC transporter permease [Clostridia bacterium]
MFFHNFKYTLKSLFKNKSLIFWAYAFPIILCTFFNLAFSNIENSEKLNIIDIGIVENKYFQEDTVIKETFTKLSDKNNKDQLFNITYTSLEEVASLLNNDKITGYLILTEDSNKVVIKNNGINETILKYVTEEIFQTKELITNLATNTIKEEIQNGNYPIDYEKIYQGVFDIIQNQEVKINDISNKNLSYTMIEYYTLIAMSCLYGALLAFTAINRTLANMSHTGKRVSASPVKKWKLILSSLLASYVVQLIGITLLLLYTIFVIHVDYGTQILPIISLILLGSAAGLSLGVVISTAFKISENSKTGIVIGFTMLGVFLSGMMGITMKYIIDVNIPIVNILNPANMITDGFYALYYYTNTDRYFFNIISLAIFSFIMIIISSFLLRRQKYDSI